MLGNVAMSDGTSILPAQNAAAGASLRAFSSFCPVAAESVNGSGSGTNFAAMSYAARNKILAAGVYGNFLAINDQGVTALHHQHVFVIVVDGVADEAASPQVQKAIWLPS